VRKGQHKVKKVYEKRVTTSRVSKTDAAEKFTECNQAEKDNQGTSLYEKNNILYCITAIFLYYTYSFTIASLIALILLILPYYYIF